MRIWLSNINNFYFNGKKNESGNAHSDFSNPRAEVDYNNLIQQEDYDNLLKELCFTNISLDNTVQEIFFCSSIDMSNFPFNLIVANREFIGKQFPICNINTIEYFVEMTNKIYLQKNYSVSAWIPIEDKEFVLEMGYSKLLPTLELVNAQIYTSTYPNKLIETDVNVFMAHGILDYFGFKGVYSNPSEQKAIIEPEFVFGTGKIAILFICNSGSSKDEFFSNSITLFCNQLLKYGYESVVAPFWSFDVTMSKIWLDAFLKHFNDGNSVSFSVWSANKQLSEYDQESSSLYLAPAGCLAMHLYGNPNVFVSAQ
jgi:hypothetical protein